MEDNKTFGLQSLTEARLSGAATTEVQAARLITCAACRIKDLDGDRLYRVLNGEPHCGTPRLVQLSKIRRDERHWGCGCNLIEKATYNSSECPFGVW